MITDLFNTAVIHPSWEKPLKKALLKMDSVYLKELAQSHEWLPGKEKIFSAFSLPLTKVNYVLFGESPYPRSESANGYAFWDAAVGELWSETGLTKKVNRATSLRNFIKMLLVAEGHLNKTNQSQEDIAKINKQSLIQTNHQLFTHFLAHGFLLLNTTPVLHENRLPQKEARFWYPFMQTLLNDLLKKRPQIKFILLGRIANTIDKLIAAAPVEKLYAEHPYNHSFIVNPDVLLFFNPLHLLRKKPV